MSIQPYLFFNGDCEDALAFYEAKLGAERLMAMRYSESPEPLPAGMIPDDWGDKIMHGCIRIGDSQVMVSDGCAVESDGGGKIFRGFQLTLTVKDEAEAQRVFGALAEGGQVTMPLGKTFFSPSFGMVADRFGVPWAVVVPGEPG